MTDYKFLENCFAGLGGVEPPVRVLETRGLPLTDAPKSGLLYTKDGYDSQVQ